MIPTSNVLGRKKQNYHHEIPVPSISALLFGTEMRVYIVHGVQQSKQYRFLTFHEVKTHNLNVEFTVTGCHPYNEKHRYRIGYQ